jgi:hypothetical protein
MTGDINRTGDANPFRENGPLQEFEMSSRTKLAVVDEHNTCLVYDINTKDLLFQVTLLKFKQMCVFVK